MPPGRAGGSGGSGRITGIGGLSLPTMLSGTPERGLVAAIAAPATARVAGTGAQRSLELGPARVVAAEVVSESGRVLHQRRGLVATVLAALAVLVGVQIARRVLRRS